MPLHNNIYIKLIILTILILFLLFQISIYKHIIYQKQHKNVPWCERNVIYKKILYSDIKNNLKSGDLLFFISRNLNWSHVITRGYGHNEFTHIGIIIKINNKLYSCEMVESEKLKPGSVDVYGFNVFPLKTRVKNYIGDVYVASLINPLSEDKYNIFRNYIHTNNYKFPTAFNIYKKYLFNNTKLNDNDRYCGEFVSEILYLMGISDIPKNAKNEHKILELSNLCNNKIYKNQIHLINDDLLIKDINNSDYKYITYC